MFHFANFGRYSVRSIALLYVGLVCISAAPAPSLAAVDSWSTAWAKIVAEQTISDDINVSTTIMLSPTFKELEPEPFHVRALTLTSTFSQYQIPLGNRITGRSVHVDSSATIQLLGGTVDTSMTSYLAAKALNKGVPPFSPVVTAADKLLNIRLSVTPVKGRTWGTVESPSDLVTVAESYLPGP